MGMTMTENEYIPSFFKYEDGIATINITEYDYPKEKFNLKNEEELIEFIKSINILYNQCNDDRITYDDDANDEYYKRDNIVSFVNKELTYQKRALRHENDEYKRKYITAKIEVLNYLQEKINRVLE